MRFRFFVSFSASLLNGCLPLQKPPFVCVAYIEIYVERAGGKAARKGQKAVGKCTANEWVVKRRGKDSEGVGEDVRGAEACEKAAKKVATNLTNTVQKVFIFVSCDTNILHKAARGLLSKMTVFSVVQILCLTCKIFYVIIWTIKWRDYAFACVGILWVPIFATVQ